MLLEGCYQERGQLEEHQVWISDGRRFIQCVSETLCLLKRIPEIKVRCVDLEKGGALSSA